MADSRALGAQSVEVPWGAWSDSTLALTLPGGWQPVMLPLRDAPALDRTALAQALDHPVGASPLEELAIGRRRVVIAIDDFTRPTRTAPLVSLLISKLATVGISHEAITVLIATGAHRPATADDIRLKTGMLPDGVRVVSHDPVHGVEETGVTLAGQTVRVNREYLAADLRIGIGGVLPHPFAGFSGGGKILLPGLSDLDAVVRSHKYALMGFGGGLRLEGNRFRKDMEKAVREIGIDWTLNVVLNSGCDTAALVAGDVVDAHRAAVEYARAIGTTPAPPEALDALVLNAYPKDTELLQIEAALVALRAGMTEWLKPEAPVVLIAACPDGLGSHQLFGPGGRLFRPPAAKSYLGKHVLHIVSPATQAPQARAAFSDAYPYYSDWDACVAALGPTLPASAVVGFAPYGPLHVPAISTTHDQAGRPVHNAEVTR